MQRSLFSLQLVNWYVLIFVVKMHLRTHQFTHKKLTILRDRKPGPGPRSIWRTNNL